MLSLIYLSCFLLLIMSFSFSSLASACCCIYLSFVVLYSFMISFTSLFLLAAIFLTVSSVSSHSLICLVRLLCYLASSYPSLYSFILHLVCFTYFQLSLLIVPALFAIFFALSYSSFVIFTVSLLFILSFAFLASPSVQLFSSIMIFLFYPSVPFVSFFLPYFL